MDITALKIVLSAIILIVLPICIGNTITIPGAILIQDMLDIINKHISESEETNDDR